MISLSSTAMERKNKRFDMPRVINNIYSNAGVHGATGYEFQKHCALYVLLSEYLNLEGKDYCIYMEHADDFVYCFFNKGLLREVKTYQAKKNSKQWTPSTLNKEIIVKLCVAGAIVRQDQTYQRESDYQQASTFITNCSINLTDTVIDESNEKVSFASLGEEDIKRIKENILDEVGKELFQSKIQQGLVASNLRYDVWISSLTEDEKAEFDAEVLNDPVTRELPNLCFMYLDFPRKQSSQEEQLVGRLTLLFNNVIHDKKAAIDTLLTLFTKSTTTFNQGDVISFANNTKKISSDEINACMNIVTTKTKAYEQWRNKASDTCKSIRIPSTERKEFEQVMFNSFDYFKDLTKTEHQKIFLLTKSVFDSGQYYSEDEIVQATLNLYRRQRDSRLSDTTIKAISYAAALELFQ